jgi:hypothetical protein
MSCGRSAIRVAALVISPQVAIKTVGFLVSMYTSLGLRRVVRRKQTCREIPPCQMTMDCVE